MAGSNLISKEKNYIHIPVYYRIKKNKYGNTVVAVIDDKKAKEMLDKGNPEIQILNTKWISHTWQINNQLFSSSQSYNNVSGQSELDWQKYQDNMFKTCLVEWDMADENGNPITVTPESLDQLPFPVARELIKKYDKTDEFDEEEAKK